MPLVINSLRGGHTHTYRCPHRNNSKKPGMLATGRHAPGLKRSGQELKGLVEKDIESKWAAKASCF